MDAITRLTDTALMAALHDAAFEAAWSKAAFDDLIEKSNSCAFGTTDGFIVMQPLTFEEGQAGEAEIITLAVRPSARRGGLAGRLIEHARCALQLKRIFLEVAADNEAARALYTKLGFVETGQRKAYYKRANGPRVDGVLMQGDFPPPI